MSTPRSIVILGTTASGKTKLAVDLAYRFDGEIVSADSRQVYKGMDIGSGKDLADYRFTVCAVKGSRPKTVSIPYHLIDVVKPMTAFNIAKYQKLAAKALEDIAQRGHLPIICGGTGLYLQVLVDGYHLEDAKPDLKRRAQLEALSREELWERLQKLNPKFAAKVNESDRRNPRRLVRYLEILADNPDADKLERHHGHLGRRDNFLILGLDWPKEILAERIHKRLIERLEKQEMIGEVRRLHSEGVSWKRLESLGLEYRFIARYLQEKLAYDEMLDKLERAIILFTKHQKTWWRRWEKQGIKINWVKDGEEAAKLVKKFIGK